MPLTRPAHARRPPSVPGGWPAAMSARDGERLWVRTATEEDRPRLVALHARCTERSLRHRFFAAVPVLTTSLLDHLVGAHPSDHLALVVQRTTGELVAVANLVATPFEATDAEIGLLVADDHQGRGIGTTLFRLLREAARLRGLGMMTAYIHADNVAMRRLLPVPPRATWSTLGHGIVQVDVPTRPLTGV